MAGLQSIVLAVPEGPLRCKHGQVDQHWNDISEQAASQHAETADN